MTGGQRFILALAILLAGLPGRAPLARAETDGALEVAALAPPPREAPDDRRCASDGTCIRLASYVADVCGVIETAARRNRLDPSFFARLIWKESLFDAAAVSPAGAQGIAQFMPGTAELRGLADPFNPAEALLASARLPRRPRPRLRQHRPRRRRLQRRRGPRRALRQRQGRPAARDPRLRPGHHRPLRRRLARRPAGEARPRAPRRRRLPGRLHRPGRDPHAPRVPLRPAAQALGRHRRLEPRPRRRRAPGRPPAEPPRRHPRRRAGQLHPRPPPRHGQPPLHGPDRPREPRRSRRPLRRAAPERRRLHGPPQLTRRPSIPRLKPRVGSASDVDPRQSQRPRARRSRDAGCEVARAGFATADAVASWLPSA